MPAAPRPADSLDAVRAALPGDPALTLLALDYDGTLAPIVADPDDAAPAPGAVEALHACAAAFGTVAIVTGRSVEQIRALVGDEALGPLLVLGLAGLERWSAAGGLHRPPPLPGIALAREELTVLIGGVGDDGIRLEDKELTLAVHTRQASEPERAWGELAPAVAEIGAQNGLELLLGRLVLELRPPGHVDKGSTLIALAAECAAESVLFAGDDVVDLPAIKAVATLRERGMHGLGIFVDNAEAPDVLRDAADLVVPSPAALVRLLHGLADAASSPVPR